MNTINKLNNTRAIPGLEYRAYRGETDFPAMVEIWNQMRAAGFVEGSYTLEDVAIDFRHLYNCDPFQDMIFAELNGAPAAFGRVMWLQEGPVSILFAKAR